MLELDEKQRWVQRQRCSMIPKQLQPLPSFITFLSMTAGELLALTEFHSDSSSNAVVAFGLKE